MRSTQFPDICYMTEVQFAHRILLEDNHLLVINKKPGWLSQGDQTGDQDVLAMGKQFLKEKYHKPGNVYLAAAHRLDRPVSGVLVLAKTSKAQSRLAKAFRERKVSKTYWAISNSKPKSEQGRLEHYLKKDRHKNVVTAYHQPKPNTQKAVLEYQLQWMSREMVLLEVTPLTGRPHQIRVQLATLKCSIIGDVKYGAPAPLPDASIALHARKIIFPHPIGARPVEVVAPLPEGPPWNQLPPIMD